MKPSHSVCLVSPGHLSSNPRLVKEADALAEAGFRVSVISCDYHATYRTFDRAILERAVWTSHIVPFAPSRPTYVARRLLQAGARLLFSAGWRRHGVLACASHVITRRLTTEATCIPADLYIGHCLAALPAVVAAGSKWNARIGFDAEDFHSGEAAHIGRGRLDNAIARCLELALLRRCHHFTASSPCIAQAYRQTYGLDPTVLLNVFPLSHATDPQPAPAIPSFYWFSQTIGSDRGLEPFLHIARSLGRRVRLDLRGGIAESYRLHLRRLVLGSGVELRVLPPDTPDSMVRHAAGYTAGLALEQPNCINHDLCLSNKSFTYLLAGVPVLFSRTRAQEQLAAELGPAALLIDLDDPACAAAALASWICDAAAVRKARACAFALGRTRFNWDLEKRPFLAQVKRLLHPAPSPVSCSLPVIATT